MKIDVSLAKSAGLDTTRFPQTQQEVEVAEQAIADALAKLSLDDHEKILLDVHGCRVDDSALSEAPPSAEISCSSNDDSSATNSHRDPKESLLQQLDQELHRINTDKEAYKMAMDNSKDPTFYGKSRWFRLAFLRAEHNDASKAAAAIVAHFTLKRQLFGDASLPRHVRFSDLSARAEKILCSGVFQVLPVQDAAGRLTMAVNPSLFQLNEDWNTDDPRNSVSVRQAFWYFHMELFRQEGEAASSQSEKGIVVIIYHYEQRIFGPMLELRFHRHFKQRMTSVLPVRVDATHFCHRSPLLRPFFAGIQLFIDPHSRFRLLSHCGNVESVHERLLQTYGVPTTHSPMASDGSSWSIQNHLGWIAKHRQRDDDLTNLERPKADPASTSDLNMLRKRVDATIAKLRQSDEGLTILERPTSLVPNENGAQNSADETQSELHPNQEFVPMRFDVLFGKDKMSRLHTGNLRAMHLCDMYWDKYEAAGKYEKTEIAERIVTIIHESSGRFWKENDGVWEEATDKEARQKIAHFFRQKRHDRKKQIESMERK